jgi:hypothetical protein
MFAISPAINAHSRLLAQGVTKAVLAFLLPFITAPVQSPDTVITARVTGVVGGGTIHVLVNGVQLQRSLPFALFGEP